MIDPILAEHATPRELECLKAVDKHGSGNKAAKATGCDRRGIDKAIQRVKKRAAMGGWSPANDLTHPTAPGFGLKRVSTNYKGDGSIGQQWVIQEPGKMNPEMVAELLRTSCEEYRGHAKSVKAPKSVEKDMLVVYPMGDPHIGMYAWAAECGDDFDCDIAERNLTEATQKLVDIAPAAETAVVLNLGDFFHSDNQSNRTAKAGNALDVDSRWSRVFQIGFNAMIQCVDLARHKHKRVIVKNLIGNHDEHTSQALAFALDAYFHNDKRVEVDTSPSRFWYYEFGKVLIQASHGDTAKPIKLGPICAADVPEMWGRTTYRYSYGGHIHSTNKVEFPGIVWESFRTLAAKDSWHSAEGYRSGRDMYCLVHHKDHGEIQRFRVDISMLGTTKKGK